MEALGGRNASTGRAAARSMVLAGADLACNWVPEGFRPGRNDRLCIFKDDWHLA